MDGVGDVVMDVVVMDGCNINRFFYDNFFRLMQATPTYQPHSLLQSSNKAY